MKKVTRKNGFSLVLNLELKISRSDKPRVRFGEEKEKKKKKVDTALIFYADLTA